MRVLLSLAMLLLPVVGVPAAGRTLVVKGVVAEGGDFPALDTLTALPASVDTPLKGVTLELRTDHRTAARGAVGGPRSVVLTARSDDAGRFELPALELAPGESVTFVASDAQHLSFALAGFETVLRTDDIFLSVTLPTNARGNPLCGVRKPYSASFSSR